MQYNYNIKFKTSYVLLFLKYIVLLVIKRLHYYGCKALLITTFIHCTCNRTHPPKLHNKIYVYFVGDLLAFVSRNYTMFSGVRRKWELYRHTCIRYTHEILHVHCETKLWWKQHQRVLETYITTLLSYIKKYWVTKSKRPTESTRNMVLE